MEVVNLLAADIPLPYRNHDHPLSGEWADHRDCHVKPDLISSHLDLSKTRPRSRVWNEMTTWKPKQFRWLVSTKVLDSISIFVYKRDESLNN
jgi:hypothetical protein